MAHQTPYKHSPEEGTPEAEQQPWRVHITVGSQPEEEDEQEQTTDRPTEPVD